MTREKLKPKEASLTDAQRYALVLRTCEAINVKRDLGSILEASAEVLVPVVPFVAVAIIAPQVIQGRPYVLHLVGLSPSECERVLAQERRGFDVADLQKVFPEHQLISYPTDKPKAHAPYTCPDILQKREWFAHEFKLAAAGIRAYAALPLQVRGDQIGVIVFSRCEPETFTLEQISILMDVARPIASAVANAIAWHEIQTLRDQLQAENLQLRSQLAEVRRFEEIVGDAPPMRRVLAAVEQVAATDATVLITGETGTGKELIARAIHRFSPRASKPLIKVNCAAIPETLLASELFGHERGAFTNATERRKGRFEMAHNGTLFLDEIGELSPEMQVMLLRVLQEREFERLGGTETIRVNVRVIAATNRDLAEDVRAGRFRSDLFYRLNVFPVHVPALRQRPEDIPLLVAHFVEKHSARFNRKITRIDQQAMNRLQSYDWPGNARELENVIERAVILSPNGTLQVGADFFPQTIAAQNGMKSLQVQERELIEGALRASGGKISGEMGAAKRLGLPASTLEFRVRKLGIDKYQYRRISQ